MSNSLVYGLNSTVIGPGSLGIGTIKDEGKIRFVVTSAGAANVFRIRVRLINQSTWIDLIDLTGNDNQLLDVFGYDQLEVICLVFQTSSSPAVRLVASSFDSTTISINTPDGSIDGTTALNFVSTNGTVDISGDPNTGEINFRVTGQTNPPYTETFLSTDWALAGNLYELEFPRSSHVKGFNPTVTVFEDVGGNFEEVETILEITSTGDVTISVSSSPDLRFNGKIIIS